VTAEDGFAVLEEEARKATAAEKATKSLNGSVVRLIQGKSPQAVFFANLACRLERVVDWTQPTGCTNGKLIKFNPDFVGGLTPAQADGFLVHEVCHVAFLHPYRMGARDPELANIAMDLAINSVLLDSGFQLPSGGCVAGKGEFSNLPSGLSFEEYYAILSERPKEPEDDQQDEDEDGGGSDEEDEDSDQDEPADDEDDDESDGDGDQDDEGDDADDQQEGKGGDGEPDEPGEDGDGGGDGESDEPGEDADADGGGDGPAGADPGGCGGVEPPPTPAEARQGEAEARTAVLMAGEAAKGRGDVGAGLQGLIGSAAKPPVDWRDVLREFVSQKARDGRSWNRVSRRHIASGLYMPGRFSRKLGRVAVLVDTSGSTQPYLAAFGAALDDILSEFDCEAVVAYHDVPVQKVSEWEPGDEPFELENIGGGGTSHVPVFDWLAKLEDEPTCAVAFTDCYTTYHPVPAGVPVLWAVCGNPAAKPPYGQVVHLTKD